MSFFTTSIKPSSEDIPGLIFVRDMLIQNASYICEEIIKKFDRYDISPYLLNDKNDLYIEQNHLINFCELKRFNPSKR